MKAMKKSGVNDDQRCRHIVATASSLLTTCFFVVVIILFLAPQYVVAEDDMTITRDKDKTIYTIGPSEKDKEGKTEYDKDKERAWDMLKNMNIIIDKQTQGTTEGNGQSGK